MRASFFLAFLTAATALVPITLSDKTQTPLPPNTGVELSATIEQAPDPVPAKPAPITPVRVRIPRIALNAPIVEVTVTAQGDLDVPDGSTKNVGWYAAGTTPGAIGSAVLDAHVFAAFKKLRYALPGTDIYVDMSDGRTLHYKIQESTIYKLSEVPAEKLFNRSGVPRLNLITCAGKLTPDKTTYDHRLIDYAVLVE